LEELLTFLNYLQSEESLVRNTKFTRVNCIIANYKPCEVICEKPQSMPSLLQHRVLVHMPMKDSIYRNWGLSVKNNELKVGGLQESQTAHRRKEEVILYDDKIDCINNATVKVCDRTKFKDTKGETVRIFLGGDREEMMSESQLMILGMGYTKMREYAIQGYSYTFFLNDFADLSEMITPDRKHIEFKATLTIF
jgi:hypothetical protein